MSNRTARVRFLFSCWLLLVAAALPDEAAAQGTLCGTVVPGQVDPVTLAGVSSQGINFIRLDWEPPHDSITGYYYTLSCPTCPTQLLNTTADSHTFSGLTAATEYSFSIRAGLRNCNLSTPYEFSGKTILTNLDGPVNITDVTEMSFRAHWAASPDAGVQYEVSCAGTVQSASAVCSGLESGARIEVTVRPVKAGFPPANYIRGTAFTKLFAIDARSARFSVSETAISVSWTASSTAGVSYQLTCRRVSNGEATTVSTFSPYAICGSLQSGEAYNLSVAVKKLGGFDDAVTQLPTQLTKSYTTTSIKQPPPSTIMRSTTESPISTTHTDANRGPCPSQDWLQFSGFCYLLVKGSSGRSLTEAVADCQSRDSSAHLLWVTSKDEMAWLTDHSARNWRLREDYRAQCRDCRFQGDAAWTGLYRDVADGGKFKWLRDDLAVNISVNWLVGPSQPPMNFGFLFDAPRELLWRTYQPEARHFHFCKAPVRVQQAEKKPAICPTPDWTPLRRDRNGGVASPLRCSLLVHHRSLHLAREQCLRWAPNAELHSIRRFWGLDGPSPGFFLICRIGPARVKINKKLPTLRSWPAEGQAERLAASSLNSERSLLLSSLLSSLLPLLMRLCRAA